MTPEQREDLISQASKMFATEGIKSVRMDDIAHRVGISKRTLYEEFGDKEELIFQALKHHFEGMKRRHISIASSASNILIAVLKTMRDVVETSESNWALHVAMQRFYPSINKRLRDNQRLESARFFRLALEDGVNKGLLLPRINLDLIITMLEFISTSVVLESQNLILPKGISRQDAFEEMIINIMRGMSTSEGVKIIDEYLEEEMRNLNRL